jgi:hypothetical protein
LKRVGAVNPGRILRQGGTASGAVIGATRLAWGIERSRERRQSLRFGVKGAEKPGADSRTLIQRR